ncbi:hypothetical protein BJV82DRAFT_231334 [Fennellomyces sp. T-0311]|nr:hypothetical protein BJV82DRAFT_231334 [Fennellomyces sp. T-0311]
MLISVLLGEEAMVQEEEEEHDKWITDAYRGGIEAPTSCLVHHDTDDSSPARIRIQEHLLDSEYLDACRDGQAVLWPVLPLRL